jgi:hypothetical protein
VIDGAETPCPGCGTPLEADQLACLKCGEVRRPASGRDRRWIFSTGGIAGIALLLVTSASFAATTALKTGDPHATQAPDQSAVAQAPKPQTPAATEAAQQQQAEIKKQKAAEKKAAAAAKARAAAPPPAPSPAPAPAPSTPPPATPPPATPPSATPPSTTPTTPPQPAVALTKWEDDPAGAYTVVVYKFPDKAGAKLKAQEVAKEKLPAGVFHSDDYESLEPGSWVVFIGEFDTADQASKAEAKYDRAGYPGEVTYVGHQQSPQTDQQATPATTTP